MLNFDGSKISYSPIENPREFVERFNVMNNVDYVTPLLPSNIVKIRLSSFNKNDLLKKEKEIKEKFVSEHHQRFMERQKYLEGILAQLREKKDAVAQEIKLLEGSSSGLGVRKNMMELTTDGKSVLLERKDYLFELNNRYENVMTQIKNIQPSRVLPVIKKSSLLDFKWLLLLSLLGMVIGITSCFIYIIVKELK